MALEVWDFTGFEAGDLGEFRPALVSNVTLTTVAVRHGSYAGRLNLGASVTGFLKFEPLPFPHYGGTQLGFGFKLAGAVTGDREIARLTGHAGGYLSLRVRGTPGFAGNQALDVYDETGAKIATSFGLGGSGFTVAAGQWYFVEIRVTPSGAGVAAVRVAVDGVEAAEGLGAGSSGGWAYGAHTCSVGSVAVVSSAALDAYFDDVVVEYGTLATDTLGLRGSLGVSGTVKRPNGAGAGNAWSGAATLIDDWPGANDGDTTAITSGTVDADGYYTHESAAGWTPSGRSIVAVGVAALGRRESLTAANDWVGLAKNGAGSIAEASAFHPSDPTAYRAARRAYARAWGDGGAAWTEGLIDGYQFFFRHDDLGASIQSRITAAGLFLLHTAAVGAGGSGGTPAAPSGLAATAVSATQIDLTWTDNAADETGFKVERSADGVTGWAQIGTTGANDTDYSDTGLSAGETWYYRVRATNGNGDSGYSGTANATTHGGTVPAAPSALTATGISGSRIRLEWQDNATDETGFEVERSATGTGGWGRIATVEDNVTRLVNSGLGPESTWFYRVRAVGTGGNSAYSNVASGTTLAAGVGECAVTPYATVADVQARIWTDVLAISDESQPARADVEDWLCQESHWMDSTFAWKYRMPAADPEDRERLRLPCADLVAGRVWRVLVPRNPGQEARPEELRGSALVAMVYQPGSVRTLTSSLGRLASDPPREGRSFLVLPNTALTDTGEAALGQPEGSFTDPEEEGPERLFGAGREW